jgi:LAS seventeen-binding protein 5
MIVVATEKGKQAMSPTDNANPGSPVPEMDSLSINPTLPPRPSAPPRPPAASKSAFTPAPRAAVEAEESDDSEVEDENDPFADRNAL